MEEKVDLRVRKPVGAVLSVRVPRDLAIAADEFARDRSISMSELVRLAVEDYLAYPPPRIHFSLYGSTIEASLVLNSAAAGLPEMNRGGTQTRTLPPWEQSLTPVG
jgi:hypothetical protein